jgi:hypothetical protein
MEGMTMTTRKALIWATIAVVVIGLAVVVRSLVKPDVEVEVLNFAMPYGRDAEPPAAGLVWAAIEVEVCSNVSADDGVAVGEENWLLELPDETRIPAGQRGVPGAQVPPGGILYMLSFEECVSDWVTFAVPEGAQPAAVIFTGPDGSKRFSLP